MLVSLISLGLGLLISLFKEHSWEDTSWPLLSVFFPRSGGKVSQRGKGTLRDAY